MSNNLADPDIEKGLSEEEALLRKSKVGPNTLPNPKPPSAIRQFLEQVTHLFALMLWVASSISLVAGMPTLSIAILAVILINAVFSFAQEWKAERQALALEQLLPQRAVVRRDGLRRVSDAALLVPGDIVELRSGDRISADIELLEVHDLELDTSTFTGESLPSRPGSGDLAYAGTFVTSGAAVGIVRATGRATRLAEIAALVQRPRSTPTPLARELRRLVETIAVLAAGAGAVFFALSRLLGIPPTVAFVFSLRPPGP